MKAPAVLVHEDVTQLARAVAARLVTRLVDAQAARGVANVVLAGGAVGTATLAELAAIPARDSIAWERLDVWWGDELFLPEGDNERHETQARAALLDDVSVNPARIHPMPPADEPASSGPEVAAERYATELWSATLPEDHGAVPLFDVLLAGIGSDGHVASLFPEAPALYDERPVVAVRGGPGVPPVRLTLTLPAIQKAQEVWLVAAGEERAGAIRMALSGAGSVQVPAAGARGWRRTLVLLDRAAASRLPPGLALPASP